MPAPKYSPSAPTTSAAPSRSWQKPVTDFPVLYSSKNNDVPISYNVFDLFGDGLASASVFIVDKNGNIAYENIGENYRHQVSGEEVLEALAGL